LLLRGALARFAVPFVRIGLFGLGSGLDVLVQLAGVLKPLTLQAQRSIVEVIRYCDYLHVLFSLVCLREPHRPAQAVYWLTVAGGYETLKPEA
jgi:hypothetical protein